MSLYSQVFPKTEGKNREIIIARQPNDGEYSARSLPLHKIKSGARNNGGLKQYLQQTVP
jgi:hypothetical protein